MLVGVGTYVPYEVLRPYQGLGTRYFIYTSPGLEP